MASGMRLDLMLPCRADRSRKFAAAVGFVDRVEEEPDLVR